MAFDYESWFKTAQDRLEVLKEIRKQIQEEISRLEAGIKAFSPLIEESAPPSNGMGLTHAIRQIFIESSRSPLAPTGIRDELLRRGFLLEQKNPLAAIHQILSRLVERNFAEKVPFQGGAYYRWKGMMTIGDLVAGNSSERLASQFGARAYASYQATLKELQVTLEQVGERSVKELGDRKKMTSIGEMMKDISSKPRSPRADLGKKN